MKSLLFRLSARLCIVTLLFQSLWPTVVLATEAEVACSPLTSHSSIPLEQAFPDIDELPVDSDYTIRIGSNLSTVPDKSSRLSISLFQRQQLVVEGMFFPGQQDLAEGITEILDGQTSLGLLWSTALGELALRWDGSVILRGTSPDLMTPALHIQTPGAVLLDHVNMRSLRLTASQVGVNSPGTVQKLALSLGTEKQPGTFEIYGQGNLQTKVLTLSGGGIVNTGLLTFEEGGRFDLEDNTLFNYGTIEGQGKLSLRRGGLIINEGTLKAPDLFFQTAMLRNSAAIQADRLKVILTKGGENSGTILSQESTEFVSLGAFTNTGTLESKTKQDVHMLGQFENTGTVAAPQQKVQTGATLKNSGIIGGEILSVTAPVLGNGGKIRATDILDLHVRQGISTGEIYGKTKANVVINEKFFNMGDLRSDGVINLQVDQGFANMKDIVAPQIHLSGTGITTNEGSIQGTQEIVVDSTTLINGNLVTSDHDIKVKGTSTLTNKGQVAAQKGLFTGTGKIENTSPTGMEFVEGVRFEDYQGRFENSGRFVSRGVVRGALAALINTGSFESLGGYQLTVHELTNEKDFLGTGTLHVHKGTTSGLMSGQGLILDVLGEMTNSGTLDLLDIIGSGDFKNAATLHYQGTAQAPSRVDCKRFQNATGAKVTGTAVIFDRNLEKWINEDQATLEVDSAVFRAGTGQTLNEGTVTTKQFVMERDGFQNQHVIQTNAFTLTGDTFTNDGDLNVLTRSLFGTKKVHNRGTIHLKGITTGTITTFHNQGEARFEGKTDLKGDTLTNEDLFVGKGHLKWVINDLLNTHTFSVEVSGLKALHQIINKGVMSLRGGRTEFWHFVNLRRVEWGRGIYEERVDLSKLPALPADQSTTFKKGFFENRGDVVSPKGARELRILGTELLNEGKVIVDRLRLDLKRLTNLKHPTDPKRDPKAPCNVLQTYQDLTGRVETIDNHDVIQSVQGKVELQGTTLTNGGTLAAGAGVLYTGTRLTNTGEVKSPQKLTVTLTGPLINGGLLRGDQGIDLKAQDVFNTGKVEIPLTAGRSTWKIARALENTGGTIAAHAISIHAQTVHNRKTISLTGTSFLRAWGEFVNDGTVVGNHLGVSAATLTNNSQIAADDLLTVDADTLKTHKDHELYGKRRLKLKVKTDVVNEGLIQSEQLTVEAHKLVNKGTLQGTRTTTISTPNGFENAAGAVANLNALTLTQSWFLFLTNHGTLILSDLRSLGGVRHLWNSLGAKMSVKNSAFKLEELTSYGYIDLATGTYQIDTFKADKSAKTILLGDANVRCGKLFENKGTLLAPIGLKVELNRKEDFALGTLKVNGDLILRLGAACDAAQFLNTQMPQTVFAGNLIVHTPTFNNPHKIDIKGAVQLYTGSLSNTGTLTADKLMIRLVDSGKPLQSYWYTLIEPGQITESETITAGVLRLEWTKQFTSVSKVVPYGGYDLMNRGDISSRGELDIESITGIDNSRGHIFGKGKTRVVATRGGITNGAASGHTRNDAYIASGGFLELQTPEFFVNDYGTTYAAGAFSITASKVVSNRVGFIWGDAGGKIKTLHLCTVCEDPLHHGSKEVSHDDSYAMKHMYNPFGCGNTFSSRVSRDQDVYEAGADRIVINRTRDTDTSQGGFIYTAGDLALDISRLEIYGSKILSGGLIYDGTSREVSAGNATSRFSSASVKASTGGNPAMLAGRQGIDFVSQTGKKKASFDITGSVLGGTINLEVGDFRIENIDGKRTAKGSLMINLTPEAKKLATSKGIIQDYGSTGQHRIGFSLPVPQPAAPNPGAIVCLGAKPKTRDIRFAMDPKTTEMVLHMITPLYMGLGGLNADLYQILHQNAHKTGKEVMSPGELQRQAASMIVYQVQQVYDTLMDIAHAKETAAAFREELQPVLFIAPGDSHPVNSGQMSAEHKLTVEADSFTNLSGEVDAEDLKVHATGGVHVETKTERQVTHEGDGVTVTEVVPGPIATMIGRQSSSVTGDQSFDALGAQFPSGPKGGTFGSAHGKATSRPLILEHSTESHGQRRNRSWHDKETQQSALPTCFPAAGPLTHIGGGGIHQVGAQNVAVGDITFLGPLTTEAALLWHTIEHDERAEWTFSSRERHQKSSFVGDAIREVIHAGDEITLAGNGSTSVRGADIKAPKLTDKVKGDTTFGMTVGEERQSSSQEGESLFGESSQKGEGRREMAIPTTMQITKQMVSEPGGTLTFESTLSQIRNFYTQKNLALVSRQLSSSHREEGESSGLFAPALSGQDPLVSSLQGFKGCQHASDWAAAGARAVSEAISAVKGLNALMNGADPTTLLLGRYGGVSFGFERHRSTCDEKLAQPLVFETEVMVCEGPDSTHFEGTVKAGTLVVLTPQFTTDAPKDERHTTSESESGSVSVNLFSLASCMIPGVGAMAVASAIPTVSGGSSSSETHRVKHHLTTVTADKIFLRVNDAVIRGTQIRAKLIDAIIKGSLTIESVLDTFSHTGDSTSLSTSADFRVSTQERQIEKINAIASMVGTEQFYLQVGKTLLTRSAEFGLRPDGMVAPSVKTEAGETLYIRPMPPYQNNCGFFGLLNHTGTATPRADAVKMLLDHARDASIRALVAPELVEGLLERKDVMTLPGGEALGDHFVEAQDEVDRAVRMANTMMAAGGQSAAQLLAADPEGTDTRLDGVRDAVAVQEQVYEALQDWASSQDTYTAFVNTIIGKPGRMLTYSRDSRFGASPTGVMDAIAKLSGRNLVIYQVEGGVITPVHAYTSNSSAPTIPLIHNPALEHFDLLEGTVSSIHAKEIIDEKLQEVDIDDSFTANMFFGTAMTLAGQINELMDLRAHVFDQAVQEGVPLEEAVKRAEEVQTQLLRSEEAITADVTAALEQQGATPEQIETILHDEGMQKLMGQSAAFGEIVKANGIQVKFKGQASADQDHSHALVKQGLTLITRAATQLDGLAQAHPTLANLSLTAVQVALGGPAGYVRNKVVEYSGLQAQVDTFVDDSKAWMKDYLKETHNMRPLLAEVLTEGGAFGITLGMTVLGGLPKEKALDAAKRVGDTVKKATSFSRVRKINGRQPINAGYAGDVFPLDKLPKALRDKYPHSVPFTGTGHPDFARYAEKKVQIKMTGDTKADFRLADIAAGFDKRPTGYTWHHHQDGTTMLLVPEKLHYAVKHTGGVAVQKTK